MRSITITAAVLACLSVAAVLTGVRAAQPPTAGRPQIEWRNDLKAAREEAAKSGRPMLILFDADWCLYCRKMEQTTLSDTSLARYINDSFVPVRLDIEKDARTAEILEVERIPCTVSLNAQADLLGRVTGYVDRTQYQQTLNQIQSLHQKVESRRGTESR